MQVGSIGLHGVPEWKHTPAKSKIDANGDADGAVKVGEARPRMLDHRHGRGAWRSAYEGIRLTHWNLPSALSRCRDLIPKNPTAAQVGRDLSSGNRGCAGRPIRRWPKTTHLAFLQAGKPAPVQRYVSNFCKPMGKVTSSAATLWFKTVTLCFK